MTDHDRINDEAAARLGDYAARELLRRAVQQLERWHEAYGRMRTEVLPPAGDVRLLEDIAEYLKPVGRAADPGDLVPLKNGRSVDLGGRWNLPT